MIFEVDGQARQFEEASSGLMLPLPVVSDAERLNIALASGSSNMGLETYLNTLGITEQDLKGLVLDLGSGNMERFSREASQIGKVVVSLNPKLVGSNVVSEAKEGEGFENGWFSDYIESNVPWQRRSVAAIAQRLPFGNETFDTIVSTAAVPGYLARDDYHAAVDEIVRILKPGGKAYFGPIYEKPDRDFSESEFYAAIDLSGAERSVTEYDDPDFSFPYRQVTLTKKL